MNASSTSGAIHVPVGLFGLATNTTRVAGVTAARIAGRSCAKSRAGTSMPVAPRALTASG